MHYGKIILYCVDKPKSTKPHCGTLYTTTRHTDACKTKRGNTTNEGYYSIGTLAR